MRRIVQRGAGACVALALAALSTSAPPALAQAGGWTLDRVVVVMRHGVRPPTRAQALPADVTPLPWPAWDVGWGELSHHGEQAVAVLGAFDRGGYAALLGSGCPAIHAVADTDQRTVRTAEVYVAALLPGCPVNVEHKAAGETDLRFSAPEDGTSSLTARQALAAANADLPPGGTAQLDRDLSGDWAAIDRILDCHAAACIAAHPTSLSVTDGKLKLGGALALGASFAETLALEYADGLPMEQVGWGRASAAQITRLLELHSAEFAVKARPSAIAQAGSSRLMGEVATALTAPDAPVFSVFVGHDTNLALIGGALGLHWQARQFAPDDPAPGGALMFERWRNASGRYRLVLHYRSQSLDEMRNLSALTPDAVQTVPFGLCHHGDGCDAAGLRAALTARKPAR
jgi:4-phytase/acid phosphatase